MGITIPSVTHTPACIALMCIVPPIVLVISAYHLWSHVSNYQSPVTQRYCIRILCIVPVYLIIALVSFAIPDNSFWILELLGAAYEAFTIYNFMALMLAFVGGPVMLVDLWESERRYLKGSWTATTCCLGTVKLDGIFLRRVVQCVIQFVVVRLIFAVLVPFLIQYQWYDQGKIRLNKGWVYATLIHNISMGVALYALLLFFLATRHYLRPFNPVLKFALIKSVIFVSFWQKIALQVLVASNLVTPAEKYTRQEILESWNMFLLIVECLPLAILNFYAFGTWTALYNTEWGSWRILMEHGDPKDPHSFPKNRGDEERSAPKPFAAFSHAVNASDVLHHAYTTFTDNYGKSRYMALELSQREAATPVSSGKSLPN